MLGLVGGVTSGFLALAGGSLLLGGLVRLSLLLLFCFAVDDLSLGFQALQMGDDDRVNFNGGLIDV